MGNCCAAQKPKRKLTTQSKLGRDHLQTRYDIDKEELAMGKYG